MKMVYAPTAHDSNEMDGELREEGNKMVAPQKKNRKKAKLEDGREFRRYKCRWSVERFFAWMKNKRILLSRWEFHPKNFLGFVQISAAFLLLERF